MMLFFNWITTKKNWMDLRVLSDEFWEVQSSLCSPPRTRSQTTEAFLMALWQLPPYPYTVPGQVQSTQNTLIFHTPGLWQHVCISVLYIQVISLRFYSTDFSFAHPIHSTMIYWLPDSVYFTDQYAPLHSTALPSWWCNSESLGITF